MGITDVNGKEIQSDATRLSVLEDTVSNIDKAIAKELSAVTGALGQFGNLIDLLYLEIAVLLELLSNAGVITEKQFADQLEITGNRLQAESEERAKKEKEEAKDAE